MKKFYFMSNGKKLCGIIDGKKNQPLILFVHGWTSIKSTMSRKIICDPLKRYGYSVMAFDFYGHGESEGSLEKMTISTGIRNVIDAAKYTRKLGYKKIILVGSSFGGLCSVLAAPKIKPVALILKAPALDYSKIKFENKGDGFVKEYKKHNAYQSARRIRCPVLIVHGNKDGDVPLEQSIKFSKIAKNCKLIKLEGATHDFTKQQLKSMGKEAKEFLEQTKV